MEMFLDSLMAPSGMYSKATGSGRKRLPPTLNQMSARLKTCQVKRLFISLVHSEKEEIYEYDEKGGKENEEGEGKKVAVPV